MTEEEGLDEMGEHWCWGETFWPTGPEKRVCGFGGSGRKGRIVCTGGEWETTVYLVKVHVHREVGSHGLSVMGDVEGEYRRGVARVRRTIR
jgi:hypothetical protein